MERFISFLKSYKPFGNYFIKQALYSIISIIILCLIGQVIPEKPATFYVFTTFIVAIAMLILVLWKIDESFKDLNDSLLFFYASYLAINKILFPNETFLEVPLNVSFSDFWYASNKIEYLNLFILFLIAICTTAKAIIAYRTFKTRYINKD
ncbi:hypothetical protein [Klebsiella sp. Q11]|uniref:hypothetical protein n=1 Tax=Klebsiella sp. Q11 TaxID=857461 RepID=UPI0035669A08